MNVIPADVVQLDDMSTWLRAGHVMVQLDGDSPIAQSLRSVDLLSLVTGQRAVPVLSMPAPLIEPPRLAPGKKIKRAGKGPREARAPGKGLVKRARRSAADAGDAVARAKEMWESTDPYYKSSEIADSIGRPAPTLYSWATKFGWTRGERPIKGVFVPARKAKAPAEADAEVAEAGAAYSGALRRRCHSCGKTTTDNPCQHCFEKALTR